jgi:hypothetical protein
MKEFIKLLKTRAWILKQAKARVKKIEIIEVL